MKKTPVMQPQPADNIGFPPGKPAFKKPKSPKIIKGPTSGGPGPFTLKKERRK